MKLWHLWLVLLLTATWTSASADSGPVLDRSFEGPKSSYVDILRVYEGGPRIYVQATLPDGELGLFLVDTGADISVLSSKTAERLGLEIEEDFGALIGISGGASMHRAVLSSLQLGDMNIPNVEMAVGVRGVADSVGFMPLDGLLGNNVWGRFVLELDYPADLMVLHAPDTVPLTRDESRKTSPMHFDGRHVYAPIEIETPNGNTHSVIAQIDTGAGDLTLCAATGLPFEGDYTEGIESVRGIGASEDLPPFRFLEITRRIPIARVRLGATTFDIDRPARWRSFDDRSQPTCRAGFRVLLGHHYLEQHRVFFDYRSRRFALRHSKRTPRLLNGHQVLLEQDIARYGEDPTRNLYRAKLVMGAGGIDEAIALLQSTETDDSDERAEVAVLLASLHRRNGDLDGAWKVLSQVDPGDLVDQDEIIATVNGLLFDDRIEEAAALADAAAAARPEEGWAYVARADVQLYRGNTEAARQDLIQATKLEEFPDAHLLRRARVALATGDRYGSMAHIRKLLQLYPGGGEILWFYALLIQDERDAETFRADMVEAMNRLHPDRRPTDFVVAAHHALGEQEAALDLMREGIETHCAPVEDGPAKDNCTAWYYALAGTQPNESLSLIDGALEATGPRPDYLDTKAMVHLARQEYGQAYDAARAAARLSPDDVYMLWQAERLGDLIDKEE